MITEKGTIYLIISPTFKLYVGQTINFRKRLNGYRNGWFKLQRKLYASVEKYGFDNHSIHVLMRCKPEEMNFWETFYISLLNTCRSESGLNLVSGGTKGFTLSPETKEKLRLANLGNTHSLGKKHSEASRKRHREAVTGEKHPQFGKAVSPETKLKIISKTKGVRKSDTARKNISERHFRRPISQFSADGVLLKNWSSAAELKLAGYNYSTIHGACKGSPVTAYGFRWEYSNISDSEREKMKTKHREMRNESRMRSYYKKKAILSK